MVVIVLEGDYACWSPYAVSVVVSAVGFGVYPVEEIALHPFISVFKPFPEKFKICLIRRIRLPVPTRFWCSYVPDVIIPSYCF